MSGPTLQYGWVPQYYWDPYRGWVPQYVWHPQLGWVHGFIWAPLPPGWGRPAVAGTPRYDATPHAAPTPYLHLLRTRTYGWWKSLLGLLLAGATWLVGLVVLVVVVAVWVGLDAGMDDFLDDLTEDPFGSPGTLLFLNLNLALLIPSVWVAVLVVHQERLGWVSSVLRRLRWRLLLVFGAAATVLLGLGLLIGYLVVDPVAGSAQETDDARFVIGMLAVVLLTTPLQAAGEEYLFRGYLSQVIAGWIPPRAAGAVIAAGSSGLLFALAHGSQDAPTFASRLAFDLTASLVVWLTGGLEASIAYHTMNNVLLYLLLLVAGPGFDADVSSGLVLILDLVVMACFVAFVWSWGRDGTVRRLSAVPAARDGVTNPAGGPRLGPLGPLR